MWKGLRQARSRKNAYGYEKRRAWWEKGARLRSCLKKIQLLSTAAYCLHWQYKSLHNTDFNSWCWRKKASRVKDFYLQKRRNNHNYKPEQQQHMGSLLVQVFASTKRVISLILCRAPLENPVCSSVHPNTVACRYITHLALN